MNDRERKLIGRIVACLFVPRVKVSLVLLVAAGAFACGFITSLLLDGLGEDTAPSYAYSASNEVSLTPVERIIKEVHEAHNYTPRNLSDPGQPYYVCHNYTVDALAALNASGYEAYYILAFPGDTSRDSHAWVRVCMHGLSERTWCTDYDVTVGYDARPYYPAYTEMWPCVIDLDTLHGTCRNGMFTI